MRDPRISGNVFVLLKCNYSSGEALLLFSFKLELHCQCVTYFLFCSRTSYKHETLRLSEVLFLIPSCRCFQSGPLLLVPRTDPLLGHDGPRTRHGGPGMWLGLPLLSRAASGEQLLRVGYIVWSAV